MNQPPIAWREAGSGAPVLLLHGLGGSRTAWEPQLVDLSSEFRCVAWDMPGYGESRPFSGTMTWEKLADAVADLVEALGESSAHLVGISLGGMVAQHAALAHPALVRSLVLLDSSPQFGFGGMTAAEEWISDRLDPLRAGETPASMARDALWAIVAPGTADEVVEQAAQAMGRIGVEAFREATMCLTTHSVLDDLADVRAPTLVAVGELDRETPPFFSEALAERIPGARLEVIEGSGHYSNLEKPQEVNCLLRQFIRSVA